MAAEPEKAHSERSIQDEDRSAALLHTLALFKANYDDGHDYLTNFEPYVADVLKKWLPGDPVKPQALRDALEDRFAIPPMPINTAEIMRTRALDHDWIRRDSSSDFFPNRRVLNSVREVGADAKTVLGHVDWLIDSFRVHARDEHGLDWTHAEASAALERFVEEFSFELAMAKRNRGELAASVPDDRALTVASAFVRRAFSSEDRRTMAYLEEMVQGSMLANVLYFHELGSWSETLPQLTVYLDTPVALRALDYTLEPLAVATAEMMEMLRALEVKVCVFDHTVDEMHRILVTSSSALRRGELSMSRGRGRNRPNREVSDAALLRNWTPADLDEAAAALRPSLMLQKIEVVETPSIPASVEGSVAQLKAFLGERVSYAKVESLGKDVRSVMATHVLRLEHECRTLARTPAIFVTANPRLTRVTQQFFEEDQDAASIPHVTTDISLTNQLWVRSPLKHRNVPRRLLIAESFAALSGNSAAWERYLGMIKRQRDRGQIDAQRVKTLVGEMESRESFLRVTHGEAASVDEETPFQVLDRLDTRQGPGDVGSQPGDPEIRENIERQTDEIAAQARALARQQEVTAELEAEVEAWKRAEEESERNREAERRRRRQIQGGVGAGLFVSIAIAMVLAGVVRGSLGIAASSSLLLALAVALTAWGFEKGWTWGLKAFIALGAVLVVPASIHALAGRDSGGDGPPSQSQSDESSESSPGATPEKIP
jgi:hypothetical protein